MSFHHIYKEAITVLFYYAILLFYSLSLPKNRGDHCFYFRIGVDVI